MSDLPIDDLLDPIPDRAAGRRTWAYGGSSPAGEALSPTMWLRSPTPAPPTSTPWSS